MTLDGRCFDALYHNHGLKCLRKTLENAGKTLGCNPLPKWHFLVGTAVSPNFPLSFNIATGVEGDEAYILLLSRNFRP